MRTLQQLHPLGSSLRTHGYLTAPVTVGSYNHPANLVVDTGSHISFLGCEGCTRCGRRHANPLFSTRASSTAHEIPCNRNSQCFTGSCAHDRRTCAFHVQYEERSEASGVLLRDEVTIGAGAQRQRHNLTIGCAHQQSGLLQQQGADGVLGLGPSRGSLLQQLGISHFGLCMSRSPGALSLGRSATERVKSLSSKRSREITQPLLKGVKWSSAMRWVVRNRRRGRNQDTNDKSIDYDEPRGHYALALVSLFLKGTGNTLDHAAARDALRPGAIVDSGSTFVHVPTTVYTHIVKALEAAMRHKGLRVRSSVDPENDVCFQMRPEHQRSLPNLVGVFNNGRRIELPASNFMYRHEEKKGVYCLGIFKQKNNGAVLGAIMLKNVFLDVDAANGSMSLTTRANCAALAKW